jgi:hypothetical protein
MATTKNNEARGASGGEDAAIQAFIARWQGREGGQERANYAMFLTELCAVLSLSPPDPASATTEENDYTFERVVKETARDGTVSSRRIDLYKRGSFVLEAKQSRQQPGGAKELPGQSELFTADAKREATRDGAPAIELIDGEALCVLLKDLKLGVRVRLVEEVEIDPAFFGTI